MHASSSLIRLIPTWVLLLVMGVAAIQFLLRGPVRGLEASGDLASPYAGAHAWTRGANPYSSLELENRLVALGRERDPSGKPIYTSPIYPPSIFPLLSPIALLRWSVARVLVVGLEVVLFLAQIPVLMNLVGWPRETKHILVACIAASLLAPFHTGVALGQVAMIAIPMSILSLGASYRSHHVVSGVLLGLAIALKAQVSAVFLLYHLLKRNWWTLTLSILIPLAAGALSIGWMSAHGVPWLETFRSNIDVVSSGGDTDPRGPLSYQLINLHVLLHRFTRHYQVVNILVVAITGAILGLAAVRLRRDSPQHNWLIYASVLAVATLLLVYHRFYDAGVLILPAFWALANLETPLRRWAAVALICMIPFLVPGAILIQSAETRNMVPSVVTTSWPWQFLVIPHEAIAILILALVLMGASVVAPHAPQKEQPWYLG
jgi:hypothetical protein